MQRTNKTAYLTKIAMLGTLAFIVMLIEFQIPIFPPFLKMDFSDLIPLLGALAMGPVAGMLSQLIKCILHWLFASTTGGVGDIANFIVGSVFVMTAGFIYKKKRSRKGAVIALLCATLAMVVAGAFSNYFIMVPFYAAMYFKNSGGVQGVVDLSARVIPAIDSKLTLILYAFCPFNLLKGIMLTIITLPLYKKVSPLLHREHLRRKDS